jgi:DNA mismatch repair protein MutL
MNDLAIAGKLFPSPTPVTLERLTPRQQEQLERLGLAVEPFGNQLWAVRQAPAPLAERGDLTAALMELSLGSDLDAALVATACRTAIRNGTPLTPTEMQALLADWQRTRNPHTCPHGRPICLTLPETSLARFFRRHWVIGKSHGLEP